MAMRFLVAALPALLAGCASFAPPPPAERFMASLQRLCGQAFEGRIVSPAVPADAAFAGKRLVMHVRECAPNSVRIPFHVGEDRSRTWVINRIGTGLRLKHDHRHQDGTEDRVTQYGGDTADAGTAERQAFPADAFSRALLVRENNPAGAANVWAMEVRPGAAFAYELRRPGRFFRVEFDLTRPIAPPPPPWGSR
jgi:hypothetical protein